MNLYPNTLIYWNDRNVTERVLFNNGKTVVMIDIFASDALPEFHPHTEVESAFSVHACRILTHDPFDFILIHESQIKEKHRTRRDLAWSTIKSIVSRNDPSIYVARNKGPLVRAAARKANITSRSIYRYLKRYWQWGMTKNALLPQFAKCGGKGQTRLGLTSSDTKLGKPSALSIAINQNLGIRITAEIQTYFQLGLKRFYETEEPVSLRETYQRILETYFNCGFELQGDVAVPILPPANEAPSYRQFYYFYDSQYRNPVRETKARKGEARFLLDYREIIGNSTDMAFGPGSVYQVDATLVDLYLLSTDRRKIIGRPVVYLIVDVFSRMITGLAVLLEGPSWVGAMLALDNTFSDKVTFCAEYGIEISREQWPCEHLPKAILADRGEFEGYNVDTLISSFGVVVHNTPPYRADYKGIIERQFKVLNERFVSFIPGAVYKHRNRGEPDYRLDAVLTLREFTKLMIAHILSHNQNHYLGNYRKDEEMIKDEVSRYPSSFWDWGIKNRSGYLRVIDRNVARMNLLPRKEISLTPQGLHFERELYYSCDSLISSGLMMRKRKRKYPKIVVAYDPRDMEQIYIPGASRSEFIVCPLTPAAKSFKGQSLYDAQYFFNEETQNNELSQTVQIQSRAQFNAIKEQITATALEAALEVEEQNEPISKSQRVRDIRKNRTTEKQLERDKNKWSFDKENAASQSSPTAPNSVEIAESDKNRLVKPISNAGTIRSMRNKKRAGR